MVRTAAALCPARDAGLIRLRPRPGRGAAARDPEAVTGWRSPRESRVETGFTARCSATSLPVTGQQEGRPRKGKLMDPVTVPAMTALAGVAIRAITYAELLARLRWQERRQRASHLALTEIARELPPGSQLDELRADGSRLHLQTAHTAKPAERSST